MEVYSTEEQQEEAIKKFIKENWLVVLVGATLGLGGVYGWKYYNASQQAQQAADSDAYAAVVSELGKEGVDAVAKANEYRAGHDNKSYTVMLAMHAAKEAVKNKDFAEAQNQLKWAADNAQDISYKAVILTRLARVQAEQEKYDDALATLSFAFPESFVAQVEEIKGDIYFKQGNVEKARAAYQLAADNDGLTNNNGLQYKLDDLAQATPK